MITQEEADDWNEKNKEFGFKLIKIDEIKPKSLFWKIIGVVLTILLISVSFLFFYSLFTGKFDGVVDIDVQSSDFNNYSFNPQTTNQYQNTHKVEIANNLSITDMLFEQLISYLNSS